MFRYATPLQFISFSGQLVGHREPVTRHGRHSSFAVEPPEEEVELPPLELVGRPPDEEVVKPPLELVVRLPEDEETKPPLELVVILPDDEDDEVVEVPLKVQILSEVVAGKPGKAADTRGDCPEVG